MVANEMGEQVFCYVLSSTGNIWEHETREGSFFKRRTFSTSVVTLPWKILLLPITAHIEWYGPVLARKAKPPFIFLHFFRFQGKHPVELRFFREHRNSLQWSNQHVAVVLWCGAGKLASTPSQNPSNINVLA